MCTYENTEKNGNTEANEQMCTNKETQMKIKRLVKMDVLKWTIT